MQVSLLFARQAVSHDRLDSYRHARTDTDCDLVGQYALDLAVAEALYPGLHLVEITLRNRLDVAIGRRYPRTGPSSWREIESWLDATPAVLLPKEHTHAIKAKRRLKKDLARKHGRHNVGQYLTHGRLVAQLTFGFWTYLLGPSYGSSTTQVGLFWPDLLDDAFPNRPPGMQRGAIEKRVKTVHQLRNRVMHHERVVGRRDPQGNLIDIRRQHRDMLELLDWLCPATAAYFRPLDRFATIYDETTHRFLRQRARRIALGR